MVYKSAMQIGKHKKIPRKTFNSSSRYFSFTVAFAMPDNSVHLLFSKILPYQTLAKAIRLFVVCPLVILAQPNTSAYNMEIYSNKKALLAIMQSGYLSEVVIRRLF